LQQIRNYRALKAVEETLVDLETKMGGGPFRSVPLAYVRDLLASHKLDGGQGARAVRGLLMKQVERHPTWAEPWLELAFLCEDEGKTTEALRCFERAMRGNRAADMNPADPHPCAVAAANRGRILAAMGRDKEACASFALAVGRDPTQKVAAVQYADLLRKQGHLDRALTYYGDGMYHQECRWALPPAPRNAGRLEFHHLATKAAPEFAARSASTPAFAAAELTAERP
jgi:tetratricopeptide (TPR) repeat protein